MDRRLDVATPRRCGVGDHRVAPPRRAPQYFAPLRTATQGRGQVEREWILWWRTERLRARTRLSQSLRCASVSGSRCCEGPVGPGARAISYVEHAGLAGRRRYAVAMARLSPLPAEKRWRVPWGHLDRLVVRGLRDARIQGRLAPGSNRTLTTVSGESMRNPFPVIALAFGLIFVLVVVAIVHP
jgi:hypothetical protein